MIKDDYYCCTQESGSRDLDFQQTLFFINHIRKEEGLNGLDIVQPQDTEELITLLENYD